MAEGYIYNKEECMKSKRLFGYGICLYYFYALSTILFARMM